MDGTITKHKGSERQKNSWTNAENGLKKAWILATKWALKMRVSVYIFLFRKRHFYLTKLWCLLDPM